MTVHILGCGPAGLVAAHAAVRAGHDIRIFSRPRQSHMFGAQYLHAPVPGIDCGQSVQVRYTLMGSIKDYRRKVYGIEYDGTVSPDELEENHEAWDIRKGYDKLWKLYGQIVEDAEINPRWMYHAMKEARPTISSIPLPVICTVNHQLRNAHVFKSTSIWAAGEAPSKGIRFGRFVNGFLIGDESVLCNGNPEPGWYRASRIFGHTTLEWPWPAGPNAYAPAVVTKPISNTCDCWPNVLRVGRYGKWQKGVLVHHTYEEVEKWMDDPS